MKNRKHALLLLAFMLSLHMGYSQKERPESPEQTGWYTFDDLPDIAVEEFWNSYAKNLGLGEKDEMHFLKATTDELGMSHYIYQRFHAGIPVDGNTFTIHEKQGRVISANGHLVRGLSLPTRPRVSEHEAREKAIRAVDAKLYAWEKDEWERELKRDHGNEASYFPEGKLMISKKQADDEHSDRYKLAWRFKIKSLDPFESFFVYIHALTGEVLEKRARVFACTSAKGATQTLYNGYQQFSMKSVPSGYALEDCRRNIETKIFKTPWWPLSNKYLGITPRSWSQTSSVTNSSINWTNTHQIEASAHWIAQESWDYLKEGFNWRGLDGQGRRIRILTRTFDRVKNTFDANNRFADDEELVMIGALPDGNGGFNHMVSIHHVAHEIFHGVILHTAQLEPARESGALAEGYCDIFSLMVEESATGSINWALCSDVGTEDYHIRDFEDPLAYNNPAQIGGKYYQDQRCPSANSGNDYCHIHHNSTIPGRAFNLLVGGKYPNQNGVYVRGIGTDKAMKIAFKALRDGYLDKRSNFRDARSAWKAAARAIYGPCSQEEYAVQMAWAAVGVGTVDKPCVEIAGPNDLEDCSQLHILGTYKANAPEGMQIQWQVPSGISYSISGADREYLRIHAVPGGKTSIDVGASVRYQGVAAYGGIQIQVRACDGRKRVTAEDSDIKLYPNPAKSYTLLELEKGEGTYKILDSQGRLLLERDFHRQRVKISLEGLTPGLYFISIDLGGEKSIKKLQITP